MTLDAAGLSPFSVNASHTITTLQPDITPSVVFWYFYSGILSNNIYGTAVEPQTCSSDDTDCLSLFFPGGMSSIYPSPANYQNGSETAFIVYDAPGYQLEFSKPKAAPQFSALNDCRVYLTYTVLGTGICIRQEGNHLLAGKSLYLTMLTT